MVSAQTDATAYTGLVSNCRPAVGSPGTARPVLRTSTLAQDRGHRLSGRDDRPNAQSNLSESCPCRGAAPGATRHTLGAKLYNGGLLPVAPQTQMLVRSVAYLGRNLSGLRTAKAKKSTLAGDLLERKSGSTTHRIATPLPRAAWRT